MAFFITDGWSVAHHHTHEAFIHLGNACRINLDAMKFHSNIPEDIHPSEYLTFSSQIRGAYNMESKECIKATILFQAGMEAWISWAYTKGILTIDKPRFFKSKWNDAFQNLGIEYDFSSYSEFYDNLRNPIVHPSTEEDIEKISKIQSIEVYKGFQHGWSANSELSKGLGFPFDENSWETMCSMNGVILLDKINGLGNLQETSGELLRKMQEFYNKK